MFSFAYNYQTTYNQALGRQRVNFKLYLERPFKPAWVGEKVKDDYYLIQEKTDPTNQQGYFYNFMVDLWLEDNRDLPLEEANLLILGLGYNQGEAKELTRNDLLSNKLLSHYFQDPQKNLVTYNRQAKELGLKIYNRFQTNNLVIGYFLNFIQKNKGLLAHSFTEYWNAYFIKPKVTQKIYWQHLIVSPDLIAIDPSFYQETPWTLRTNPANPIQIQNQVSWSHYPEFLKKRNFLYFSPKFLHDNHLKVGQIIHLNFDLNIPDQPAIKFYDDPKDQQFLIAGTIVNSNNFDYKKAVFFVPYQWITNYYIENNLMPRNVRGTIYAHLPQFGNDWQNGQKFASQLFNSRFNNLLEPGSPLETETEWTEWLPGYAFKPLLVLFLVLAYFTSILMIVLLIVVFYFITQQLINHQRQTLMFLKSLGTSNQQLSILMVTILIVPLIATVISSFFGGLLVQQITAKLAFATTPLYWEYFNFSAVFFIVWILVIFILIVLFYLVNLVLIKRQQINACQGLYIDKTSPQWWNRFKLNLPNNMSPKFKIGLSFIFKNLMPNLITCLLLTLTFSIVLYTVQFKVALTSLGQAYEKWNAPYQSINYNSQLYLFSPTEDQNFLRSYQTKTTNDDLITINGFDDWNKYFSEYWQTVLENEFTFNWQRFYLTKSFSLEIIALIKDQPRFNKVVKDLENALNVLWPNDPKPVQYFIATFLNIKNQFEQKVENLSQRFNYQEGFNIYFGQTPLLPNNRNVWVSESFIDDLTSSIPLIAFTQKDKDSQKHFGFDFNSQEADYTVTDNKNYNYLRINISSYLATKNNYQVGQKINLIVKGLKNDLQSQELTIPIYINKIITENNVTSEIYTSQEGLFYYLIQMLNLKEAAKKIYENLLNRLNQGTDSISNSVYDQKSKIPWGIQNLTLPLYHNAGLKSNGAAGTRIEDFYDQALSAKYFESLGKQVVIFDQVSQKALKSSAQFIDILNILVIIFVILLVIISIILTNLFLLENQRIIVTLKVMGYQKNEIQWYLIGGYLIAAFLAIVSGIGLSYLIFELTKNFLSSSLGFILHFIWSWQYILTFLGLGLVFWLIIKVAISLFIKNQKLILLIKE